MRFFVYSNYTKSRGSVIKNIFSLEIQTLYALKTVTSFPFFPF